MNRFSLLPEPHVGLWGVGFLSRQTADTYVRWPGTRLVAPLVEGRGTSGRTLLALAQVPKETST